MHFDNVLFVITIHHLQVIADSATGLLFKNKRDRKIINVDPKVRNGTNFYVSKSQEYINYHHASCPFWS